MDLTGSTSYWLLGCKNPQEFAKKIKEESKRIEEFIKANNSFINKNAGESAIQATMLSSGAISNETYLANMGISIKPVSTEELQNIAAENINSAKEPKATGLNIFEKEEPSEEVSKEIEPQWGSISEDENSNPYIESEEKDTDTIAKYNNLFQQDKELEDELRELG